MADREEILEATARVRLVREGVTKKLEQYRQQYEQMHIRALSAEMEAASVKMKLEQALRDSTSHQGTVLDLVDQLGLERMRTTENETGLKVAKEKIVKLRSKLKIEFDKMLKNQKDLRVGINSFMRCIHEFRSGVISQEDFFCAVDLIFSSLVANDSSFASSPGLSPSAQGPTQGRIDIFFNSSSLQELVSLPPEQRRRRLEMFIDRLSPDRLFSPSSDKLLSFIFEDSTPPPLPSKPNIGKFRKPLGLPSRVPLVTPPPLPPKMITSFKPYHNGLDVTNGAPDSDSDYEESEEIQKIRHSTRTCSDSDIKKLAVRMNGSTTDKKETKKSDATRPKMVTLRRSRSCDELLSDKFCSGSGGSKGCGPGTLPCQYLEVWHKMVSIRDSSVLTGSLPRLHIIGEEDDNHTCYITPNEFRTFVCQVKGKGERIDQRVGMRVMKRVDSLVKSYRSMAAGPPESHYLTLIRDDENEMMGWLKRMKAAKEAKKNVTPPKIKSSKPRVKYENHDPPKLLSKPLFSKKGKAPPTPQPVPLRIPQKSPNFIHSSVGCSSPLSSPPPHVTSASPTVNERFDDPVYEVYRSSTPGPSPPPPPHHHQLSQNRDQYSKHRSESPPISSKVSRASPLPPSKSHLVDIELRKRESGIHSNDYGRPPALLPRPKPKPPPKPHLLGGIAGRNDRSYSLASSYSITPDKAIPSSSSSSRFPDQIPTYCTLKHSTHSLRLVPILCDTKNSGSDSEEDPGDYSLGTFQFVMNKTDAQLTKSSVKTAKMSSSDTEEEEEEEEDDSDGYETPPDAAEGYIEPRYSTTGERGRDRSYTTNLPLGVRSNCVEKQGYMHKLDPSLKRWTRRWFVLKGKELKYFSKKSSRKPKGIINLETWCKISRHEMTSSFQLATPARTYHFVADSNTDCEDWMKALQMVMRMCQNSSSSSSHDDIISGWIKVFLKNSQTHNQSQSTKCWVSILDQMLHLYQTSSGTKPLFVIDLATALIRLSGTVPPSSSHFPRCTASLLGGNREEHTIVIEVGGTDLENCEDSEEIVILAFSSKEEQDLWFYHLISSSSGDTGTEITLTEKLVARLWRSEKNKSAGDTHGTALWGNPLLMYTSEQIQEPLISHPSAALGNEAIQMFRMVNLFITTEFDSLGFDYHIMSFQQLVSKCITFPGLRDELYCQILRQISCLPDGPLPNSNILQGWFLLALLIPLFLPTRKIFRWYLGVILVQVSDQQQPAVASSSAVAGVAEAARLCRQKFLRAEKKGPREKTPSWFEVHYLMSGPIHISRIIQLKLKLPVNLMNDTTLPMEFDSSTDVQEFISQLNQEIGMPDSQTTGFALMSDWPGEDDVAGFYLFPNSKLCDVISTWSECLSELGNTNIHTRNIQLTYRKRLYFHSRKGRESDKEAVLLAYQMSKDALSEIYYVGKVDLALDIGARMAQIDYGDFEQQDDPEQTAKDAIRRFCPMKFTKTMLPHDMDVMVERLLNKWKGYHGTNHHTCARMLLSLFADSWDLFGSTLFHCMDRYSVLSNIKNGPVLLAIHEAGITLLNVNYLNKPIVTYSYKEVATFGSHGDDFMLVVNSRRRTSRTSSQATPFHTEKIILSMSKLKIREATYLMASYLDTLNN